MFIALGVECSAFITTKINLLNLGLLQNHKSENLNFIRQPQLCCFSLPMSAPGMVPSLPCPLLMATHPLPMSTEPQSISDNLPGLPPPGPLQGGDQESNLKKQTLKTKKQRGNSPFPPPGFLVVFMTLPWAAVWDGDAGYGQKKEQLKAALVGKSSCELHHSGLLAGKCKSARSK